MGDEPTGIRTPIKRCHPLETEAACPDPLDYRPVAIVILL